MSETFTKLFGSITDSTIWSEDDPTRIVWITMLAMADRHGYVGASIPGLAVRARVSVDSTEKALKKFLSPDKYSRSQEYQGCRISLADRGWNLLNYDRFRDMRDEEARKEYERNRKRLQREKIKQREECPGESQNVPESPAVSAQAEAEAEEEREREEDCSEQQKSLSKHNDDDSLDPELLKILKECSHLDLLATGKSSPFWDSVLSVCELYPQADSRWLNLKIRGWNQWFESHKARRSKKKEILESRIMGWLISDIEKLARQKT